MLDDTPSVPSYVWTRICAAPTGTCTASVQVSVPPLELQYDCDALST